MSMSVAEVEGEVGVGVRATHVTLSRSPSIGVETDAGFLASWPRNGDTSPKTPPLACSVARSLAFVFPTASLPKGRAVPWTAGRREKMLLATRGSSLFVTLSLMVRT